MEFIIKTIQENEICINSPIRMRENSPQIDYLNKVSKDGLYLKIYPLIYKFMIYVYF